MIMKRLIATVSAGITAAALSTGAAMATELTYSSWIPWTHPVNLNVYIPWIEAVEKASNGKITFKRLPKAIASPQGSLDAVRTGQADVSFSVHGYARKQFAPYLFAELPLLGDSAEITSIALQRTHDKYLADKGLYKGLYLVGMMMHGPGQVHHTKKVIATPADMEGQKMRTGGVIPKAITEAWGGVSISQPSSKSYEILSSGIADGIMFPYESVTSFNLTDVTKYSTNVPGGWYSSSHFLFMNKKTYDNLPADEKAIIDQFSGEAFAKIAGHGWDVINAKGLEDLKANGNTIEDASPELIEAISGLRDQFLEDYYAAAAAEGLDGKEIYAYFQEQVKALEAEAK
ncbi:TRAP transporter substrate-binding protein [Pseudodonghicola flavimaris]|uniref:TRAP transporter substrate-binding protein n=1 Tax=Pseudodonghicola flavimaris TaxID=3050036 RepID=A0ABT7F7U6_9RHOB|nr:TRAP transporter substrate-binding protein [Pseudodonghicola flavimaris]MDK3020682.1 TRAP transporter substrate-binding protein [Pseudodonghicola flavimaris]